MNKNTVYFGIDVSKDVLDVYDHQGNFHQFSNSIRGFKKLLKMTSYSSICVMESTGYYHVRLAYFLLENGVGVCVENPLKIKRYIQMNLSKIKTDKSDAKQIYNYALSQSPSLWKGESKVQQECLQIVRLLSVYTKQRTQLKNKIHGEEVLGIPSKFVLRSLKKQLKSLNKEVVSLEELLTLKVKEEHQKELSLLTSIPSIGSKTALALIVFTDGFQRFDSAKELCSYAGITPIIRESGSSIKGKPRISKIGNTKLRNLLFMCSFNAYKYNKACKALYQRLVAKGKSKKLALIAVCNKLLKQAFAIVKSGLPYDENFVSKLS
ncbi:IS110 family transposase [Tenacibaculum sp. SZ-18]|uniref:transposase n=1 Tax=Tenacibaculum sp. SZ-18 TaxID=754423 RepID=UPI000C2D62DA|nr:transposase [Tenacibaculum sp. SZ-18]AUC15426.1 IS110 family transposase [Tenacibaculum sp. SZ-18]AUC16552.1 IS110 family transposase [Tenacibaculum sp. SZ-18]